MSSLRRQYLTALFSSEEGAHFFSIQIRIEKRNAHYILERSYFYRIWLATTEKIIGISYIEIVLIPPKLRQF